MLETLAAALVAPAARLVQRMLRLTTLPEIVERTASPLDAEGHAGPAYSVGVILENPTRRRLRLVSVTLARPAGAILHHGDRGFAPTAAALALDRYLEPGEQRWLGFELLAYAEPGNRARLDFLCQGQDSRWPRWCKVRLKLA